MNFLKKKIKGHKKAIEDDEDYGDYIPPTPPHPDDLLKNQQNLATPFAVNNEYFTKANQSIQPLPNQSTADPSTKDNNEEPKNQPKFIRKPKEEKEEWKFFEQLTARVQATVSKTEKELEKIKATTNVDEIEAKTEKEYYFHEDLENLNQEFEERFSSLETEKKRSKKSEIKSPSVALNLNEKLKSSASNQQIVSPNQPIPTSLKSFPSSLTSSSIAKKSATVATTTSEWIGFNRDSVEILDDDDDEDDEEELKRKEEEEKQRKKEEEERKKREELLKKKLVEDFGFTESESSQNIKDSSLDKIINYEEDYLDDPFNTELAEKKYESTKDLAIKIEKLEKELSSTHLNKPTTLDLSSNLNKQIDRTTSSQNIKGYSDNRSLGNKYSSVPCTPGDKVDPDEIDIITTLQTGRLSRYNSKESLALSETLISRTNSVQSIHSILSNQSRRSSNPFDIETNADDQQVTEENENVPNLIAELTQEFYKTIGNLGEEEEKEIKKENQSQEKIASEPKEKEKDNLIEENKDKDNQKVEKEIDKESLSKVENELNEEVIINETSYLEEKEETPIENKSENSVLDNSQFDESENSKPNIKRDFEQLESEQELNKQDLEEVQNYIKEQIPFDPFETIVEDEPTNSNRQSVSSPNDLSSSLSNKNLTNKQNSLEKDSAFKENLPSNETLNKSESSDKNDLNNNSKKLNEPIITEVSSSSDQSLVIDEQLLTTNDYFDPFKTVNDLTPTSEVYTVGEDQSDLQNINNLNTDNIDNIDISQNDDDLPPPPADLDYPEEEEDSNFYTEQQRTEPEIVEIMDDDAQIDDLPPPPPELTEQEETQEQSQEPTEIDQQKEEIQEEPIEEVKKQGEETLGNDDKSIEIIEESEQSIKVEVQDNAEKESDNKEKTAEPEEEESKAKEIDLGLNLDDNTISAELSNLVVDPFDTSIYEYETIKSFIPVASKDEIDEFNEKFNTQTEEADKSSSTYLDPFKSPLPQRKLLNKNKDGFDTFDPFITTKPPKNTPVLKRKQVKKAKSTSDAEDEDSSDFSSSESEPEKLKFVIKARMKEDVDEQENLVVPLIPGPPQTPTKSPKHQLRGVYNKPLLQVGRNRAKIREEYKRIHKKSLEEEKEEEIDTQMYANLRKKWEEEHPDEVEQDAPLFVEDTTVLEEYDNPLADPLEWNFYVRYPIKKKITANRFWKLATVKFLPAINTVQLFNYVPKSNNPVPKPEDCAEPEVNEENIGEPLQELLLQGSYGVSEIASQQYDEFGKIFTIKIHYKFYKEKVAADTGKKIAHELKLMQGKLANLTKKFDKKLNDVVNVNVNVNNIVNLTNKDSFLVATAMLQHTPQLTELLKFGSHNYESLRRFKAAIEQVLFKMPIQRDRALTYRAEEMQIQMQDEYYCEMNTAGVIIEHKARVRLFLLSFLNENPVVEIGINDRTREGKEIVGRNDIMPISTEEWIRVENVEFHHCVDVSAWKADDKLVKLIPPDACTIEVMRFRVRPSKNRELPLIVSATMLLNPKKVELRIEAMAAGAVSKKVDADVIPCEDIVIKVHIPECWIYFFRTEKHTRFGSVKSASRRPGKIKGIERFLGATTNIPLETSLLEASAGQAKYEHAFHSLVWRIPRLPKEGQGAYRQQTMTMRLPLTESFDKIPDNLDDNVYVEFRMPATTISHAVVRSISISQSDSDAPPEKYASYVSKIDYKLKMSIEHEKDVNAYNAMISSVKSNKPIQETPIEEKDSDDDIVYSDSEEDEEE